MRIPGDSRTKGDRSVKVRCGCGADLLTLPAGQVLASGEGSPVPVKCSECGRVTTLHVKAAAAEPTGSAAP